MEAAPQEPDFVEVDFSSDADKIRGAFAALFPGIPPLGPDLLPTSDPDLFAHSLSSDERFGNAFTLHTYYNGESVWSWPASLDAILALLFTIQRALDSYAADRVFAPPQQRAAPTEGVSPREAILGKQQDPTEMSSQYTKPRE